MKLLATATDGSQGLDAQTVVEPSGVARAAPTVAISAPRPPLLVRTDAPSAAIASPPPPVPGVMYRWKDAKGTLHLTSDTPPSGVHAEVIAFTRTKPAATLTAIPELSRPADRSAAPRRPAAYEWLPQSMDELLEQVGDTLEQLQHRRDYLEVLQKDL
ncbi:MAG: DUF4124 domain-containing protein [Gammaproteobacteria bacterium]|nr:DUF4124 domain-containing protein [Gammaproteobacteria bacterium]